MSLGADGLREVAEIAVLNNNYLLKKVLEIRGVSAPYAEGKRRIEQVRYSWEQLTDETGVHSEEIGLRAADFGVHYWTSHHPYVVPEPMTLEPTESYSKADLDEYAAILKTHRRGGLHQPGDRQDRPAQQHRPPHRSRAVRQPGRVGGDLAGLPAQDGPVPRPRPLPREEGSNR